MPANVPRAQEPTGPHRLAGTPIPVRDDRPNVLLIIIGIVLMLALLAFLFSTRGVMLASGSTGFTAVFTLCILVACTLVVFGMAPITHIRKTKDKVLALGIPFAIFTGLSVATLRLVDDKGDVQREIRSMRQAYADTVSTFQRQIDSLTYEQSKMIVLQAQESGMDSRLLPGGGELRLLDVDSFSDDKLAGQIGKISDAAAECDSDVAKQASMRSDGFEAVLRGLGIGGQEANAARETFRLWSSIPDQQLDDRWTTVLRDSLQFTKDRIRMIKKKAYALVCLRVPNAPPVFQVVFEGGVLKIGSYSYKLDALANPSSRAEGGEASEATILRLDNSTRI